jgi:arylsulfatase A-like enzyme
MIKRTVVGTALGVIGLAGVQAGASSPNIVLICADDLGIGDVGAYGFCDDIPTPHMDSIAANGVLCEQGYVTCPQCGPSRAGLLTGRYQQTIGYEFNFPTKSSFDYGLPRSEQMIFSRMKAAGYRTGVVGKWHMGRGDGYCPWDRDVDYYYGVLNGHSSYFPPFDWAAKHLKIDDPTDIHRNSEVYIEKDSDYLTEAFARECADFIKRNRENPFFLYAAFTAPHVPIQYRDRHIARVAHIEDMKRREYAALVVALDDGVGRILQELKDNGLWENTLLFFISDNGAAAKSGGSNAPFQGWKGNHFEGGIRVPYLVQWPGTLPAGSRFERPVSTLDVAATTVALAGGKAAGGQRLDGVNLIPYLTGEKTGDPHEFLYYKMVAYADQWGVRHGDWMLMGNKLDTQWLYNIADDPQQKKNVAAQHPEVVSELQAEWERWNKTTVPTPWSWRE